MYGKGVTVGGHGRALLVAMCVMVLLACGGPGPTTTPAFARHRADDAWRALGAASLPVSKWQDDPDTGQFVGPHSWDEAKSFAIDGGAHTGKVYTFATPADRDTLLAWYAHFGALVPYTYTRDNVLLLVDFALTKQEAARYEAALNTLH